VSAEDITGAAARRLQHPFTRTTKNVRKRDKIKIKLENEKRTFACHNQHDPIPHVGKYKKPPLYIFFKKIES